jgi:hypothetical protein
MYCTSPIPAAGFECWELSFKFDLILKKPRRTHTHSHAGPGRPLRFEFGWMKQYIYEVYYEWCEPSPIWEFEG